MWWRVLLMVPVAAVVLGCSSRYPVKGKVQFSDGTSLTGGMVIFTDEAGLNDGIGEVGPDGSFEITYDRPGSGLPKGTYRVSVRPPHPDLLTAEQRKGPRNLGIALKYQSSEKSGIEVKIDRERTDLVIELEKNKGTPPRALPKASGP
jgi:hypothetical protein